MTNKLYLFFPVFLLSFHTVLAQDAEKFNAIYTKVYLEISQKDFNRAIELADSLYRVSETPDYKAKSLMLSASLYEQKATDPRKSIEYAKRAYEFLKNSDNYIWKTRILGFLASQHRLLQLYTESEYYANLAIEFAHKIPDKNTAVTTLAFLVQEKAFAESEIKNYETAIELFDQAADYFNSTDTDDFLILQNIQYKGQCYLKLEKYDEAYLSFSRVLDDWGELPDNYIKSLAYTGLARVYIKKNNTKAAQEALKNAEKVLKGSEYLEALKDFWEAKIEYYAATGESSNLKKAYASRDSINQLLYSARSKFINENYSKLKSQNLKNHQRMIKQRIAIASGILALLGLMVYLFYCRKKKNKELKKIKQYIGELKKNKKKTDIQTQNQTENKTETEPIMTQKSEEKILYYLDKFEENKLFTKNNLSLSWLATYCKTNNKYLSYCINKHKEKDFNNYINELRIEYIILKLLNDPVYRKYKIATLAEEAGFSSQNKFSTVFKKITSIQPSKFIDQLSKSDLEYKTNQDQN